MDFSKYWNLIVNYASEYSLKIVAAIVIFVVGKWLINKLTVFSKNLMMKAKVDTTLVEFLGNVIYFVLLMVVIIAALSAAGIDTTSFIAIFGAASLAIGLALKDSLSNIGAAVIIIVFRPFKVGDVVEVAGAMGEVKEINLFSTILEPIDKSIVIIPNSSVLSGNIINYSNRTQRRVDHIFSIGYEDDLKVAKEILYKVISEDSRVLKDPEPLVAVHALAAHSVDLAFRVWVGVDEYWNVYFDMLEKVKLEFDQAGITIPYPQMEIHNHAK